MILFKATPFLLALGLCGLGLLREGRRRWLTMTPLLAAAWVMCWGGSELCLVLRNGLGGEIQPWNECCGLVQYRYLAPMLETFPWAFAAFVVLALLLGPLSGVWKSDLARRCFGWGLMLLALTGAVLTDFWCLPLRMTLRDQQKAWTQDVDGVEVYRPMGLNILYSPNPVVSSRDILIFARPEKNAAQVGTILQGTELDRTVLCFTQPTTKGGWRYSKQHDGFLRTGDLLRAFRGGLSRQWLLMEDSEGAEQGRYLSPDLWRLDPPINTVVCLLPLAAGGGTALKRRKRKVAEPC